jgi:hypothetical protein
MTLGLWWYLHEHPVWATVHLLVAGLVLTRGLAALVTAVGNAVRRRP